jgi:hypothetical protein
LERILEPELMDEPVQARAYAEADFARTDQAFIDHAVALLSAAPATAAPPRTLDLGCGPGCHPWRSLGGAVGGGGWDFGDCPLVSGASGCARPASPPP